MTDSCLDGVHTWLLYFILFICSIDLSTINFHHCHLWKLFSGVSLIMRVYTAVTCLWCGRMGCFTSQKHISPEGWKGWCVQLSGYCSCLLGNVFFSIRQVYCHWNPTLSSPGKGERRISKLMVCRLPLGTLAKPSAPNKKPISTSHPEQKLRYLL